MQGAGCCTSSYKHEHPFFTVRSHRELAPNACDEDLQLTRLPGLAVQRIAGLLTDVRDLSNLSQTCKRLNQSLQCDLEVWKLKLEQYFGLKVVLEQGGRSGLYRELFANLYRVKDVKYPLRYVGILTDGGCQEERLSYWMDHMFFPHSWQYHCSGIFNYPNQNIHALAALAGPAVPTHPLDVWVLEYRDFLQQRFPAFQQYGDLPLHRWEYMFEHLMHMMGDGAGAWEFLLNGLKSAEIEIVRSRISQIVEELRMGKPCRQYGIKNICGDSKYMIDERRAGYLSNACISHHTAIVREIFISREGTVTCPIRTGVIYLGTSLGATNEMLSDVQATGAQFQELTNHGLLSNFNDVRSLTKLLELSGQGSLPRIHRIEECGAGSWVELELEDSVLISEWRLRLGAAVWFQFRDHMEAWAWWQKQMAQHMEIDDQEQVAPFGITIENTQGRCQMNIELNQTWTGNVCLVKMIDCENLMEEYNDDNPASNIDINTVRLTGSYVQLPQGIKPAL